MPFERPTLAELVDRVEQDLVSKLELDGSAVLRRAFVRVLARVIAGAVHLLYGLLVFLARQLFPDLAAQEYLLRHARLYGYAPTAATYAAGSVTMLGTSGTIVPLGTPLQSASGVEYKTTATATMSGIPTLVPVVAVLAGAAGNANAGLVLTFESPIAGVNSSVTVAAGGLGGGSEAEDIEAFRARFLEFLRTPVQGGASSDYVAWAKQVAGVTRAWVYPGEQGSGSVVVRFVRDGDVDPIPNPTAVAAVQTYLNAKKPVTANVVVVAPVAVPWNFSMYLEPNTTETRAAVETAIDDLFTREAEPGGVVLLSHVRNVIGSAEGVTDYNLFGPVVDLEHDLGKYPKRGTMDYT